MTRPMIGFTIAQAIDARLAKAVTVDEHGKFVVHGYEMATWFNFDPCTVPMDLRMFGQALAALSRDRSKAVVRGALLDHVRPGRPYLRRCADPVAANNSLMSTPRSWIAVDIDDAPAPAGLDWLRNVPAAVHSLQTLLPPELRDVGCIAQVTGSAGFTGDALMRLRLWYMLATQVDDDAARRWGTAWNQVQKSRVIDTSIYSPVQLHYTAPPRLARNIVDPVGRRWHLIEASGDQAALSIPVEPTVTVTVTATGNISPPTGSGSSIGSGFEYRLGQIGGPDHGFFQAISKALGAAILNGMDRSTAISRIRAAILAADPGHRTQSTISRYADAQWLAAEYARLDRRDRAKLAANELHLSRIFPSISRSA